jgi:replicative DNA helicase
MANWELKLVTKIIDDNDMKTANRQQIRVETFHTAEARSIWTYLDEIYRTKSKLPTRDMVKSMFQTIRLPDRVPDDLEVLCDHVRKGHLSAEIQKYALEISELAPSSPEEAAARLSAASTLISQTARVGEDHILSNEMDEAKREYSLNKKLRMSGRVLGIAYPWDAMTLESGGMMGGEFILFYGRPKTMKTFITCHVAAHAYFVQHRKVLFFTREMSPEQIRARVLCSISGIDYNDYRKGQIPEKEETEFFRIMTKMRQHEQDSVVKHGRKNESMFVIASDTREEGGGISSLKGMIEQYEPDIVFVDGIYLMRDDRKGERSRDWKAVSNITSDLKQVARHYKIPVVGNTQANRLAEDKRKGGGLRDLAFSDSAGQDADLIIRVQKGMDDDNKPTLTLAVSGAREFALEGIVVGAEPCNDFEFVRILKEKATPQEQRDDAKAQAAEMAHSVKVERGHENRSFNTRQVKPKGLAHDPESRVRRAQKNRPHAPTEENVDARTRARDRHQDVEELSERTRAR